MMMEEQHAPPDAHLGWPPAASRRGTAAAAQGPGLLAVPAWGGRAGRRWWRCWWWWSGACCLLLLCWPGRGHDQGPPVEARRGRLVQPHGPRAPRARRSGKWGGGGRRRSDVCPLSVLCCNSSLQTTVAAEDRESKKNDCQHAHAHPPTHPPLHPSRCLCRAGALASCCCFAGLGRGQASASSSSPSSSSFLVGWPCPSRAAKAWLSRPPPWPGGTTGHAQM